MCARLPLSLHSTHKRLLCSLLFIAMLMAGAAVPAAVSGDDRGGRRARPRCTWESRLSSRARGGERPRPRGVSGVTMRGVHCAHRAWAPGRRNAQGGRHVMSIHYTRQPTKRDDRADRALFARLIDRLVEHVGRGHVHVGFAFSRSAAFRVLCARWQNADPADRTKNSAAAVSQAQRTEFFVFSGGLSVIC